jgi:hypothetical protein
VIELDPVFAPEHAANIEKLVREKYFDGLAVVRSHDNYVVQWGDPDGDDPKKARPLGAARATVAPELSVPISSEMPWTPLPGPDGYAAEIGFSNGPGGTRSKAARPGSFTVTECSGSTRDAPNRARERALRRDRNAPVIWTQRHRRRRVLEVEPFDALRGTARSGSTPT